MVLIIINYPVTELGILALVWDLASIVEQK